MNKHRMKYLIVGGLAVNLYGLHRLTRDLDLMIEVTEENLNRFIKIMKEIGYSTPVPLEKRMNVTALSFFHKKDEYKQVDIFIKNPISFAEAYRRRKVFRIKKLSFSCASKKDIITMKEKSGRDRDLIDIGSLELLEKRKS